MDAKDTRLEMAIRRRNCAEVIQAIKDGGNPNGLCIRTKTVSPMLHTAVSFGTKEIVVALLDSGADINAVDAKYNTVLLRVPRSSRLDIYRLLIAKGATYGFFLPASMAMLDDVINKKIPDYTVMDYVKDEIKAGLSVTSNPYIWTQICERPACLDAAKMLVNLGIDDSTWECNLFYYVTVCANSKLLEYLIASDRHLKQTRLKYNWSDEDTGWNVDIEMLKLVLVGRIQWNRNLGYMDYTAPDRIPQALRLMNTDIMDPIFDDTRNTIKKTKSGILNMGALVIPLLLSNYDATGIDSPLYTLHAAYIVPMVVDIILSENL